MFGRVKGAYGSDVGARSYDGARVWVWGMWVLWNMVGLVQANKSSAFPTAISWMVVAPLERGNLQEMGSKIERWQRTIRAVISCTLMFIVHLAFGQVRWLNPPFGYLGSNARGVSDDGQVVVGSIWDGQRRVACMWYNGYCRILPVPESANSEALSISADGRIIVWICGSCFRISGCILVQ